MMHVFNSLADTPSPTYNTANQRPPSPVRKLRALFMAKLEGIVRLDRDLALKDAAKAALELRAVAALGQGRPAGESGFPFSGRAEGSSG